MNLNRPSTLNASGLHHSFGTLEDLAVFPSILIQVEKGVFFLRRMPPSHNLSQAGPVGSCPPSIPGKATTYIQPMFLLPVS
jgi:hypothetical protein